MQQHSFKKNTTLSHSVHQLSESTMKQYRSTHNCCFKGGQHYVPRYLCSPVPMFPEPMFPGTYVPRYLCSPVPMFPEPMLPGTYVPQYLCSPNLCSPVPMFPDLLRMCCRAYIRRPSDRHWNCRAAKRNISRNVKT